jgi:hypothetical protein
MAFLKVGTRSKVVRKVMETFWTLTTRFSGVGVAEPTGATTGEVVAGTTRAEEGVAIAGSLGEDLEANNELTLP